MRNPGAIELPPGRWHYCVMRRLHALIVGAVALATPLPHETLAAQGPPRPEVAVDPRVELMTVLFRLAGADEYQRDRNPPWRAAFEAWGAPLRDHPAVAYARRVRSERGVSFDAPMSLAVHLPPFDSLEAWERWTPLPSLDARWRPEEARAFAALAARFARESRFEEFLAGRAAQAEAAVARANAQLDSADLGWVTRFFGGSAEGPRFHLVQALGMGSQNFGPRVVRSDGTEDVFSINGVDSVGADGLPVVRLAPTLVVHEFGHSFVNPATARHRALLEGSAKSLQRTAQEKFEAQAYGAWTAVLDETLDRAVEVRYVQAHRGDSAARIHAARQVQRGFWAVPALARAYAERYESDRARYPTFADFLPVVRAVIDSVVREVSALRSAYEAARPRLVSASIPNGTRGLPAGEHELAFTFDRPMEPGISLRRDGDALYPEVLGYGWDADRRTFRLRVRLAPGQEYRLRFNETTDVWGGTRSAEGVPLATLVYALRTAPAE